MKLTRFQIARIRWAEDSRAHARGGFWMILIQLALFVAIELFRPKPEIEGAKAAGLGDFNFPTATEGRVTPIFWGTVRMDGPNVIWYGDLVQEPITEKVKTSLFSSQRVVKGYRYKLGMQFGLAWGEVTAITGLWIGDDRVWTGSVTDGGTFTVDSPDLFGGDDEGQGGFTGTFKFFGGSTTQLASSYLSTYQQQGGDTPGYRGMCYLCPDTERWYVGNSTSIKPYKFELQRFPSNLGLTLDRHIVNSADANPIEVLYEVMTDTDWGLGYLPSDINVPSFVAAAETLFAEGNGMSYMITSPLQSAKIMNLIEEQIDGLVRFNPVSAQWEIKLARADYTPGTLPLIDESNIVDFINYSRGTWSGTTNQVRTQFVDRTDEYKTTYAMAQDTANVRIQGFNVSVTKNYPGVFDRTLANNIAWRDLRTLSYPLAKASVMVDREFWDALPGDVVEFSYDYLGIERLPMRVTKIDLGEIENGRIRLDLVQDVFYSATPSFSDPTSTGWTDPTETLTAFPVATQRAFEAPRAVVRRDPATGGALVSKVMAAARQSGSAIAFDIRERHAAGAPSGTYTVAGKVVQFVKIGQLNADLTTKSAYPLSTLLLSSAPDTQTDILGAVADITDTDSLGTELINLCLVGDEFMLVRSAQANAANVQLNDVYRGVLDSVQGSHVAGADVFVLASGAGLTDDSIPETDNVDVKLIPVGFTDELLEASATTISFQMDKRLRRPYPPSMLSLNGVDWDTTLVNLEGNGSGPEDYSVDAVIRRRDYRLADDGNELAGLADDAETLDTSFPAANTTDHNVTVRHDPTGTDDLIGTETIASTSHTLLRIDILTALSGAVPTGDLEWTIQASHDDGGETLTSRQSLVHVAEISTALSGQFEFGLRANGVTSALYTATTTGTYAFTLSSAFTVGNVQYRLNGGAWTNVITAGGTSGNVSVTSADTVEVRHTSTDASIKKQLDMGAAGAGQDGFAIFN